MPSRVPSYHPPGWQPAARTYERLGQRREDKAFYSGAPWIRVRDLVRAEEPLCRECLKEGRVSPTEAVDHIIDRKDRPDLAYDRSNLQGLCRFHHNAKRRKAMETR